MVVLIVGLDKQFYSGHSLRAWGATDLFVAKVPYPIIKKAGRWKSDAGLVYHRDDDDVAKVLTEAFHMLEVNWRWRAEGKTRIYDTPMVIIIS